MRTKADSRYCEGLEGLAGDRSLYDYVLFLTYIAFNLQGSPSVLGSIHLMCKWLVNI